MASGRCKCAGIKQIICGYENFFSFILGILVHSTYSGSQSPAVVVRENIMYIVIHCIKEEMQLWSRWSFRVFIFTANVLLEGHDGIQPATTQQE